MSRHMSSLGQPDATPISALRAQEKARQAEEKQKRFRLIRAVVIYGAVLSILAMYVTLPARLVSTAYYNFTLERPALFPFLRASAAALVAGIFASWLLVRLSPGSALRARNILVWLFGGVLYGLAVPFITGLLMPVAGIIVDALARKDWVGGFWANLGQAVLDTPVFTAVYGLLGVYVGLMAGVLLAVGAWLSDLSNTSTRPNVVCYGPYVCSLVLSLCLTLLVMLGPFSVFSFLVRV